MPNNISIFFFFKQPCTTHFYEQTDSSSCQLIHEILPLQACLTEQSQTKETHHCYSINHVKYHVHLVREKLATNEKAVTRQIPINQNVRVLLSRKKKEL